MAQRAFPLGFWLFVRLQGPSDVGRAGQFIKLGDVADDRLKLEFHECRSSVDRFDCSTLKLRVGVLPIVGGRIQGRFPAFLGQGSPLGVPDQLGKQVRLVLRQCGADFVGHHTRRRADHKLQR